MQNVRATNWSLTINNPTEKDEEEIARARQQGWSVEGQKEVGEEGTPHYQLHVKTPQVRFSAVKKMFSRAHIEVAKSPAALAKYVQKEETRVGQLSTSQDQYPSLSKLWELIYIWLRDTKEVSLWDDVKDEFCVKGSYVIYVDSNYVHHRREPLSIFDDFIKDMIKAGYFVETMGINPQIRGSWNSYWFALLQRTGDILKRKKEDVDKSQTDRQQTSEESRLELNVPIIHNPDAIQEEVCSQEEDDSSEGDE